MNTFILITLLILSPWVASADRLVDAAGTFAGNISAANGVFAGGLFLTNDHGTVTIEDQSLGNRVWFYPDGSIGVFPNGPGGFYGGSDGHANFGGANNQIFFDSGDGGIWTQDGSGSELDDGSGNMMVESALTVEGKLTVNGGTDPPYVLLDLKSEAAIKGEVEYEVPTNKFTGAALFWNGSRHALEIYCPSQDSFYDVNGNLLSSNVPATPFTPTHPILHTTPVQTNGVPVTKGL